MGKQSRQKQARRDLDVEFAKIPALRAEAVSALKAAEIPAAYPSFAVPPAELMAAASYELAMAAGVRLNRESAPSDWAAFSKEVDGIFDHFTNLAYWLQEVSFDKTPDCKPGCNWCCYSRVTMTAEEGARLAGAITELPDQKQIEVRARIAARVAETDTLSAIDILRKPRLCPLNENGQCLVYDSRPVVCRAAHSYNVRACRAYVESNTLIPARTSALVQEIGRFVGAALRQTRERLGLDTRAFELSDLIDQLDGKGMPSAEQLDRAYRPEVEATALMDARRVQAGFA